MARARSRTRRVLVYSTCSAPSSVCLCISKSFGACSAVRENNKLTTLARVRVARVQQQSAKTVFLRSDRSPRASTGRPRANLDADAEDAARAGNMRLCLAHVYWMLLLTSVVSRYKQIEAVGLGGRRSGGGVPLGVGIFGGMSELFHRLCCFCLSFWCVSIALGVSQRLGL